MGLGAMKHRIRAAAIVVQDDALRATGGQRILLVRHKTPSTGEEWWIPPGGGIEPEDRTIMDCAVRETFEEAGIRVECRRIAYIREFVQAEHDIRHMEFFWVGENPIADQQRNPLLNLTDEVWAKCEPLPQLNAAGAKQFEMLWQQVRGVVPGK
jgi:ADP-ribose pyrophosphatase YjhB (NUDIX family)